MSVYFGDWSAFAGMVADFEGCSYDEDKLAEAMKADRWQGLDVLFAAYTYESYEGDAFVLFRKNGELYEVNGGHCSCYGLSERGYSGETPDQWEPEATTKEAILRRLDEGGKYGIFGQFEVEIRAALEAV
jgi:hypothetical protein